MGMVSLVKGSGVTNKKIARQVDLLKYFTNGTVILTTRINPQRSFTTI